MRAKLVRHKLAISVAAAFALLWALEGSAQTCRPEAPRNSDASTSSIYALTGEFRTVFANLLWIKADKYLHEHLGHDGNPFTNKEVLPMIRLIVNLDPHFVEAYRSGAMILYEGMGKGKEAEKFLHEGISNNPTSWEMYEEMGMYYISYKHDLRRGLPYIEKAADLCKDDFYSKRLHRFEAAIRRNINEK